MYRKLYIHILLLYKGNNEDILITVVYLHYKFTPWKEVIIMSKCVFECISAHCADGNPFDSLRSALLDNKAGVWVTSKDPVRREFFNKVLNKTLHN